VFFRVQAPAAPWLPCCTSRSRFVASFLACKSQSRVAFGPLCLGNQWITIAFAVMSFELSFPEHVREKKDCFSCDMNLDFFFVI
jgi:hypothetical protein